jgi:hypothetical protein
MKSKLFGSSVPVESSPPDIGAVGKPLERWRFCPDLGWCWQNSGFWLGCSDGKHIKYPFIQSSAPAGRPQPLLSKKDTTQPKGFESDHEIMQNGIKCHGHFLLRLVRGAMQQPCGFKGILLTDPLCLRQDSNPRPFGWESDVLTIWPRRSTIGYIIHRSLWPMYSWLLKLDSV